MLKINKDKKMHNIKNSVDDNHLSQCVSVCNIACDDIAHCMTIDHSDIALKPEKKARCENFQC